MLLVNLGTPDTSDARGVRVYLKEFLSDPRVIEDQGLRWKLILNGIILRVRPGRKARDYRKIWNTEKNESPSNTTSFHLLDVWRLERGFVLLGIPDLLIVARFPGRAHAQDDAVEGQLPAQPDPRSRAGRRGIP